MQQIRESLHRWLRSVMEERDWTAATWAKRADVTATNLTRFLKDPEGASLPSAETIGRLAFAAGSEPRFLSSNQPSTSSCRVPVLSHEQIRAVMDLPRAGAAAYLADALRRGSPCVLMDRPTSPRAFGLQINSLHMNAGGLLPQDQIVIEPVDHVPPRKGDMVITIDGTSLCAYRYYHPQLVPVSTDPHCCPMVIEGAEMVGVAILVVRPLRVELMS
ncbi:XRE family transcriptional regulator [Skermanella mucosa]|uniref:XRE family transcriptional regulator n=1 Tax=Skermanella mucosa TaxID=1789672 RepID=UPI00192C8598|nr:XRE family transcriptional regulator [Skermanella mucosa]UEM22520.1 XRE family transcriptional regulator [Skermanella mucosa]